MPTEAEWEYACRAGTTTPYYWGESDAEGVMKEYCWYYKNADNGYWTVPHASEKGTQPVGLKRPNAWGLYDMSGNVWEWCADWYDDEYYAESPPEDPAGPASGSHRVSRGGSWDVNASYCRSAYRNYYSPGNGNNYLGFRVSLVAAGGSGK